MNKLTIIYEAAEEGGYTAYIPEVPGAVSEGETVEEAREMVLDALKELMLARRDRALLSRAEADIVEEIDLSA